MTTTPRFDSLTSGETSHQFGGIRLADGNVITVKYPPGTGDVEEVFLCSGLIPPDTTPRRGRTKTRGRSG